MKKIRTISFAIALIVISAAGIVFAQESACKKYADKEIIYLDNNTADIVLDVEDCSKSMTITAKSSTGKSIVMQYYKGKQLLTVNQPPLTTYDIYHYNNDDIVRMLRNVPTKSNMYEQCPDKFELYGFIATLMDIKPAIRLKNQAIGKPPSSLHFLTLGTWKTVMTGVKSNQIAKNVDINDLSKTINEYKPVVEKYRKSPPKSGGYDETRVKNNIVKVEVTYQLKKQSAAEDKSDEEKGITRKPYKTHSTGFFITGNRVLTTAHLGDKDIANITIKMSAPGKELSDGKFGRTCNVTRWTANALTDTALLYVDDNCEYKDNLVIRDTPLAASTPLYSFWGLRVTSEENRPMIVPGQKVEAKLITTSDDFPNRYSHRIPIRIAYGIQKGQSGSPILDNNGHVVGILHTAIPAPDPTKSRPSIALVSDVSVYK
jgi:S1-C subfamily serine protease